MANLGPETLELAGELVALRREFHAHPEPGFGERRTAGRIAAFLRDLGLEVREGVAETGVTALIRGTGGGKTLLLRADMDALPLEEQTGLPFASRNPGMMHACGHDAHMAILLTAAKILTSRKDRFSGTVRLVFQPNEEIAGARRMIDEGRLLTDPPVDGAMALHVWSGIPSGKISVQPGPVMAAMDEFRAVIRGKGGHTGAPHKAADPVLAAANFISAAQMIQTREIDVFSPTLVMFGSVHAGGQASNIISEEVSLAGTVRYLYSGGPDSPERPLQRFERVLAGICAASGMDYSLEWIPSNPCLVNDPGMAALVRDAASSVVGSENMVPYTCTAGEDFAEFAREVPSAFFFVGTGNREKETDYPQHHPKFDIDEEALPAAVEILVRSSLAFLGT